MKRILFLAFGIMISAGLGVAVSRYTMAFTTNETVTDRIFSEAGVSQPSDSTDPSVLENLALSGDYPFQNLYLFMYNNVLSGPTKAAIKILSSQYIDGSLYSEDELTAITQNGDTTPILSKSKQKAIDAQNTDTVKSQTDAQAAADAEFEQFLLNNEDAFSEATLDYIRSTYETQMRPTVASQTDITNDLDRATLLRSYTLIMDAYNKEFDLQRDNRKLAYESLAYEMFLNNDLSDSANIDLLYDLDLAHYVLFGTYITYPDRSGGEDVNLASLSVLEESVEFDQVVTLSSDVISPYACLDDTALHSALDAFETDGSGATATAPESSPFTYPDPAVIAESVTTDPATLEAATEAATQVQQGLQNMENFLSQITGSKGDWTRSLPCGDVFCITVKLVDGDDDPVATADYAETDNCIACNVAFINQALTATTDHSLVASKVSKNWFEDATCKDAGNKVNLDINVIAIKKSIDLDPGDDTDSAPAKDVEDLKDTLLHIGAFPSKDAPETIIGKTPADVECESLLHLNTVAGSPQTLQEVQGNCKKASEILASQLASVYDQTQMEGMNANQSTLYQQVAAEFYKMAITFRNFQEQMQATYKDDGPLPSLLAKKYCE
jgi:hypothetical protein